MSPQKSLSLLLIGLMALAGRMPVQAAQDFATPLFAQQWQQGEAIVPNFWGPLSLATEGRMEEYAEAPGGRRLVQYFDKGRMELTGGTVTNGLLTTEMVTGQIQTGRASFRALPAPAIPIAGDISNSGPTYAQLGSTAKTLLDPAPRQTGTVGQAFVTSAGTIQVTNMAPSDALTFTAYDDTTQHNVPKAFDEYRARAGVATIGLALSEPFRANVNLRGTAKTVMIQLFERRVLTYTAVNDPAFRVEMGNTGQHYYAWRYAGAPPAAGTP